MARSSSGMERTDRREFLSRCSAAAASGLLLREAAMLAGSSTGVMPSIALGPHRVSRLFVGANPISGYSYLGPEVDREMKAYVTPQRIMDFLRQCEREGINTHQFSAASKAVDVYGSLREHGAKLQLIGLYSKREDIQPVIRRLAPLGLVHHGGVTDRWRDCRYVSSAFQSSVGEHAVHTPAWRAGETEQSVRLQDACWLSGVTLPPIASWLTRGLQCGRTPPRRGTRARAHDPGSACGAVGPAWPNRSGLAVRGSLSTHAARCPEENQCRSWNCGRWESATSWT